MAPHSVLLPGKSHGWRSLVGCSPWGREESDTTKQLHFHFSLSCIGEGNGNPLQCSCLESLRDGGAWWAAVYGVTQSQTQLKWLSSSNAWEKCDLGRFGDFFKVTQHIKCKGPVKRQGSWFPFRTHTVIDLWFLIYLWSLDLPFLCTSMWVFTSGRIKERKGKHAAEIQMMLSLAYFYKA